MFTREFVITAFSRVPVLERLTSKRKINENGCHIFTGGKDRCGYGMLKVGGRKISTHKLMYLLVNGDFDQKNLELMHICDNPACMNPEHLIPGTHKQNMHDCISKGRHTHQTYAGKIPYANKIKIRDGERIICHFSPRKMAEHLGCETYVGSNCKKHDLPWRSTKNGACIYCREDYKAQKRISRT